MKGQFQIADMGVRAIDGAWSQVRPYIARLAENDDELHEVMSAFGDALHKLDTLVRKRIRSNPQS